MKKTAIILGSTGLTGSILLRKLIDDDRYGKIILFSRKSAGTSHKKIEEHLVDLLQLENQRERFQADEVFCCIGTTKSKTPDEETYRKIDHGIPVSAAKLCKENGISVFVVISAMGADPSARVFYNRTKGEMERDVLNQNLPNTYILRPGLIDGDRNEKRLGEAVAGFLFRIFKVLIPKKFQAIKPEVIADTMIHVANNGNEKNIIENHEIKDIANNA